MYNMKNCKPAWDAKTYGCELKATQATQWQTNYGPPYSCVSFPKPWSDLSASVLSRLVGFQKGTLAVRQLACINQYAKCSSSTKNMPPMCLLLSKQSQYRIASRLPDSLRVSFHMELSIIVALLLHLQSRLQRLRNDVLKDHFYSHLHITVSNHHQKVT